MRTSFLGSAGHIVMRHGILYAGLLAAAAPVPALAQAEPMLAVQLQAAAVQQAEGDVRAFYVHEGRPLWFHADGSLDPAARTLLRLVETADLDGLNPAALRADELAAVLQQAESDRSPG